MEKKSDYEIGYGKPPKQSQFKRGLSGNPKGRPRAAAGIDSHLTRELNVQITVNENDRRRRISKTEALMKQLVNNAISGNATAMRIISTHLERVQMKLDAIVEARPLVPTLENLDTLTDEQLEEIVRGAVVYVQSDDPRLLEQHASAQKMRGPINNGRLT